ncbi:hypothetical protein Celaphus_00002854, partial [Cervus elaphus hippelaphus]
PSPLCGGRSPRTPSPGPGRPGGSLGKRGHIEPCLPPRPPEGPGGGAAPWVLSSSSPPITRSLPGLSAESPLPSPSTQRSPPGLSPLGPAAQGLSPLLGPVLSDAAGARMDNREEPRRKCVPADEAYFIAKEILATERTYLKDLEVITVWFRSAVVKADAMPADLMTLLFSNIDPIYEFHRGFLREVEQRLALWEESSSTQATGSHQRIGDILLRNMLQLKDSVLLRTTRGRTDFPSGQLCPQVRTQALLSHIPLSQDTSPSEPCSSQRYFHQDGLSSDALQAITEVTSTLQHSLVQLENLQRLTELQRDLVGIESLVAPGRELIREGCLHTLTRKGLQQRMFFLFSDMLLYTSRDAAGSSLFRMRGLLPLRGMLVEDQASEWSVPHSFTIYAAQKTIMVAASTQLEKAKWLHDLNTAIDAAKTGSTPAPAPPARMLCPLPRGSPDEASLEPEPEDEAGGARGSMVGMGQRRANTTVLVCWCRHTSVSRADHSAAVENQLSGYLLRKFKNSSGWQKLWVVFTNFCLFFYKTHQDDHPLASLPLLGYRVSLPGDTDGIQKEHVFKLQFKSHVYFFRADSKYTFGRWMEVIQRASASAGRARTPEEEA